MKPYVCIDLMFTSLEDIEILLNSCAYTGLKRSDLVALKASRYLYLVIQERNSFSKYINSEFQFSINLHHQSNEDIFHINSDTIQEYLNLLKLFNTPLINFLLDQ